MDPCECLWNQELSMRRLLSLLRQGQSYCTDTECDDLSPLNPQGVAAGTSFVTMFLVLAFAIAMFAMRPRSLRIEARKSGNDSQGSDGAPPTPPPAIN